MLFGGIRDREDPAGGLHPARSVGPLRLLDHRLRLTGRTTSGSAPVGLDSDPHGIWGVAEAEAAVASILLHRRLRPVEADVDDERAGEGDSRSCTGGVTRPLSAAVAVLDRPGDAVWRDAHDGDVVGVARRALDGADALTDGEVVESRAGVVLDAAEAGVSTDADGVSLISQMRPVRTGVEAEGLDHPRDVSVVLQTPSRRSCWTITLNLINADPPIPVGSLRP